MSAQRRIIAILIVLCIVVGLAGPVAWYLTRDSGGPVWQVTRALGGPVLWILSGDPRTTLLQKAEFAFQAEQFPRAQRLCERYIAQDPEDWRGHFLLGQILRSQGHFARARGALARARERNPGDLTIVLAIADTHSHSAQRILDEPGAWEDLAMLRRALWESLQANEILAEIGAEGDRASLDIRQYMGRNLVNVGQLYRAQAERLKKDSESRAGIADQEADAKAKAQLSKKAMDKADQALERAIEILLKVVQEDPTRGEIGLELLKLCKSRGDDQSYAQAKKAMMALDSPAPAPAMQFLIDEMESLSKADMAVFRRKLVETDKTLRHLIDQNPDYIPLKVTRAAVALRLGQLDVAERLCEAVLRKHPRDMGARLVRAQVHGKRGLLGRAEQELFLLADEYKDDARVQYRHALAALAVGKTGIARRAMQAVTELDAEHGPARLYMAGINLEWGLPEGALKDAERAHQLMPRDPMALSVFIRACHLTRDAGRARKALEKVRDGQYRRPDMLQAVAEGFDLLGDKENATILARRAAGATPTNARERYAVARALEYVGRGPEAEKFMGDELAKNPHDARLRFALGRLYARGARLLEAIEQYRAASRLSPGEDSYRLALARALLEADNPAECQAVLRKIDPENPQAKVLDLQVRLIQGRPIDPKEMFQELRSGRQFGLRQAVVYFATGQPDECIRVCREQLRTEPDSVDLRLLLGQAHLSLGQHGLCIGQWLRALEASPDRLGTYLALARVLRSQAPTEKVIARLAKVPRARSHLLALTESRLLAGEKKYAQAAAVLAPLSKDTRIPEHVRGRARLLRVQYLARLGKAAEAMRELEPLSKDKNWRKFALLASVDLLIGAKMLNRADELLTELRADAQARQDGAMLRSVAARYILIHRIAKPRATTQPTTGQAASPWLAKAEAVCRQHEAMLPNDSRSHLLWAGVWAAVGRPEKNIEAYRKAIACQPGQIRTYQALVSALDRLQHSPEALEVLKDLEAVGQTARSAALVERGLLLRRWGLWSQAGAEFQKLVEVGSHSESPRLRLYMATALASVGKKALGKSELRKIPSHARQYPRAQLLLALWEDDEEKVKKLEALAKDKPGRIDVLLERMKVLLKLDRPKDAAKVFGDFVRVFKRWPRAAGLLALRAKLDAGDRRAAANFCEKMSATPAGQPWRRLAVLLMIDDRPDRARKLLGEMARVGMIESLLGLCLALEAKDAESAKKWADRFYKTGDPASGVSSVRAKFGRFRPYRVLTALAVSPAVLDEGEIKAAAMFGKLPEEVIREVASRPAGAERTAEAAKLIKASVAIDLGLPGVGRQWAMEIVAARGKCQWAAAVVLRTEPDAETLGKVYKLLEPKDTRLARIIRGSQLEKAKQYNEAAQMYRLAAGGGGGDPGLIMKQADAVQRAGRLSEAMELYADLWRQTRHYVAANNAASLAAEVFPTDSAKLAQAREWAELALRTAPDAPVCLDTHGWVAFLQGRHEQALKDLRRAVKGAPGSPTLHYHLGVAESAGGSKELARWHLEAVGDIAKRLRRDDKTLSAEDKKAVALAEKALAKLR